MVYIHKCVLAVLMIEKKKNLPLSPNPLSVSDISVSGAIDD